MAPLRRRQRRRSGPPLPVLAGLGLLPWGSRAEASPLQHLLDSAKSWEDVMEALLHEEALPRRWGARPLLATSPRVAGCFSLDDVRASAASSSLLSGMNSFLVRNPSSFETAPGPRRLAPIGPEALEAGLLNGTMVLNDAGAAWPQIFRIVRAATRTFRVPANANAYITHRSLERSTPLHTDRQDVLVLQCHGHKHWEVFRPLIEAPAQHQERGKAGDRIEEAEVGAPLLEGTMSPGSLLYVPRGFVHRTSRPPDGLAGDFSVSLTVGLQLESMGLSHDKLLLCAMNLQGVGPSVDELRALTDRSLLLRRELPLPGPLLAPGGSTPPLAGAVEALLSAWRGLFHGELPTPPRRVLERAAVIVADGHRRALEEYGGRMLDEAAPQKLRQELWRRRTEALFYDTLGRCGFLTSCPRRKFWLPKYTSRQRCYGSGPLG